MQDAIKINGSYMVEKLDLNGNVLEVKVYKNLITNALKQGILKFINYGMEASPPAVDSLDINYMAFGDDDTPAIGEDECLGNELFRKPYTDKNRSGNIQTIITALLEDEANFNIKEIGLFANGTETEDSGVLMSMVIVDIEKNSSIEYNVYYRLELI